MEISIRIYNSALSGVKVGFFMVAYRDAMKTVMVGYQPRPRDTNEQHGATKSSRGAIEEVK